MQDEWGQLRQFIMGFRDTQLMYVAAKLGFADHIARKPLTAAELADAVGGEPRAVYRLLRALASRGVFAETSDGRFEMTPLAEFLRRDGQRSLRSTAMLYGDELLWRAYGRLSYSVETGKSSFEEVYGEPFYEYLHKHPVSAQPFHDAMTGFSAQEEAAILEAYDFSALRLIVDVGGGQGGLASALLREHSALRAVIFDGTPPREATRQSFAQSGVSARATFTAGDFFSTVPQGGDLYLLKSILHNWDDTAAITILSRCREAMPDHGRLLIAERIIPGGNAASEAKLFDINMLVSLGGQERTEAEYATLLAKSGLKLMRTIPTKSHLSLIEAGPIG
jgi:hypothetical protein